MAQGNNITIKFKSQGAKSLRTALKNLAKAQEQLTGNMKSSTVAGKAVSKQTDILGVKGKRLAASNGILANSFATIRSKMLLVTFAMSMGVRQLVDMVKESAKVSDMTRAFNTLSESVEGGEVGLQKLRDATNGTMSQFDLFQQANNAMILGVTRNTDEMAEMFDMAQRLGRALGRDTASSVESLITGIGRQSRLMLDNIGIIVKADEAYDSYAKKLGTTADKLSDSEKKEAFLQATMASARAKVADLGDETTTTTDAFDRFSSSSAELADRIGEKLQSPVGKLLNLFSDWVDSTREVSFAQAFQTDNIEIANKFIKQASTEIYDLRSANAQGAASFKSLKFASQEVKDEVKLLEAQIRNIKVSSGQIVPVIDEMSEEWLILNSSIEESIDPMGESSETVLLLTNRIMALRDAAKGKEEEGFIKDALFGDKKPEDFIDGFQGINLGVAGFADTLKKVDITPFTELADPKMKKAEDMINSISSSLAAATLNGQNMGEAVVNSLEAIAVQIVSKAAIYALASAFMPGLGLHVGGKAALKFGLGIAHTGGHIKEDGSVQRFATGGMVQGQDNVPILAQAGEFVMQRSAVESVGLEAMNRINTGGGGGSVVVNVSGNVMSQDFIEDEAIPMIKEAIRRGADIGVA